MDLNKNNIRKYALKSLENLKSYSNFVASAESLYYNNELFPDNNSKEYYHSIWFNNLEVINALALNDWEQDNCPNYLKWEKWESYYKKEAEKVIKLFLNAFNF